MLDVCGNSELKPIWGDFMNWVVGILQFWRLRRSRNPYKKTPFQFCQIGMLSMQILVAGRAFSVRPLEIMS